MPYGCTDVSGRIKTLCSHTLTSLGSGTQNENLSVRINTTNWHKPRGPDNILVFRFRNKIQGRKTYGKRPHLLLFQLFSQFPHSCGIIHLNMFWQSLHHYTENREESSLVELYFHKIESRTKNDQFPLCTNQIVDCKGGDLKYLHWS